MNGFLQGPRGAPGVPGPPGENGADVSWKLPSSLAVIVGSSSRRLGWPRLLLEQSGMTHQSDPCITVFSAGSGGGRIDGLSLLWLLPALSPSCVVSCPPAVGPSPLLTSSRTARRQPLRSYASSSQLSVSMPVSLRLYLQTSLKHWTGWLTRWCPMASSPFMTSFGIRPSFIWCTGPNHRNRHCHCYHYIKTRLFYSWTYFAFWVDDPFLRFSLRLECLPLEYNTLNWTVHLCSSSITSVFLLTQGSPGPPGPPGPMGEAGEQVCD